MSPTTSRVRLTRRPHETNTAELVVAALFTAALVVAVLPALRLPPYVSRLSVSNPHRWQVSVRVIDVGGSATPLASVGPGNDRDVLDAPDVGEQWRFEFVYAGVHDTVTFTRSDLAAAGWRVVVPDSMARRLRDANVPPTP